MIYEYYHELKFHENTSGLEFHKNRLYEIDF